ncbi:unnamed protein product [Mytilus edulis]|uniref:TTF-type domain-containing protein n=1 Tax=Mytilus edulis TaxID=6550 RepID=A0A8S3VI79_MYTED|nr:unnamed protein product [Mytilus edulis]
MGIIVRLVCKGSLHQGEIESGGRQCTCIALVFLTLNDIPKSVQEVDNILHKGTTTYQSLARDDNVYFLITDFPDRVSIENEIFDLSVRNPISGMVLQEIDHLDSLTFKLDSAVEQCFGIAPTCFLTTGNNPGYTIGIKNIDEHYYVMDSHSRDDKGLSSPLGKAVVLQFNSVEQLVKYIKDMCHSLSNTDMQYELTPIIIRKTSVLTSSTGPQPSDNTNEINQNNPSPQCFEPMDTEHVANDNPLQDSDISVDGGRTDLNIQQNFDAIDVGNSDPLLLTDDQKHMLICNRMPESTFKFPSKLYKDSRCKSGSFKRSCCREWFTKFEFISYSKDKDGIYCLACKFFPDTSGRRPRKLVSEPYQNWKDAITDLKRHASSETHLNSIIRLSGFQETRGLALRGHRDDDQIQDITQSYNLGNYKELVKFRAEAGDSVLDDHLKQCAKNASYTSKTSQNELLACIKRFIQQTIVDEVKAQPLGPHFGYQCDEVSDASNWEQLGIVIRYLRDGSPVEKLLEFVQAEETTGSALCGLIVKALTDAGLDIQFCRAQTMDGAGNMSGKNLGCAAQFTRLSPRTVYHYCASHNLNLVLCKCCNVPEIQLMLDSLKQLGIFFKYSPKRSRCLEKAVDEINSNRDVQNKITKQKFKVFCETRWCEKITTLGSFSTMYEPMISCLEEISSNVGRTWDKKAVIDAKGLLTKITDSTFIVSFQTVHNFFGYVTGLSRKLQGSTLDIVEGYKMIDTVKALVKSTRDDETEFDTVFEKATAMAEVADIGGIKAPRRCGRQTQRNSMIQQFDIRFGERAVSVVRALALIPNNIHQTTDEAIDDIINYYEVDMPFPDSFRQEFRLWKELWRVQNEKPTTLTSTITDPRVCSTIFPNIVKLLGLLSLTSVTSSSTERANSSFKYIKTFSRNTMGEERLNALLLLYVHKNIKLDYEKIIDDFSRRNPRKMLLVNPMA